MRSGFALMVVLILLGLLAILALVKAAPGAGDTTTTTGDPVTTTVADPRVSQLERKLRRRTRQLRLSRRRLAAARSRLPVGGRIARDFLCIHHFEGSWTDPDAPYWGGLQMDVPFMRTYGGNFYRMWGTANHWPAFVQVAVAINAYYTRGFEPWPNTSRMCGLR